MRKANVPQAAENAALPAVESQLNRLVRDRRHDAVLDGMAGSKRE